MQRSYYLILEWVEDIAENAVQIYRITNNNSATTSSNSTRNNNNNVDACTNQISSVRGARFQCINSPFLVKGKVIVRLGGNIGKPIVIILN